MIGCIDFEMMGTPAVGCSVDLLQYTTAAMPVYSSFLDLESLDIDIYFLRYHLQFCFFCVLWELSGAKNYI
jgi:hypothetical protein